MNGVVFIELKRFCSNSSLTSFPSSMPRVIFTNSSMVSVPLRVVSSLMPKNEDGEAPGQHRKSSIAVRVLGAVGVVPPAVAPAVAPAAGAVTPAVKSKSRSTSNIHHHQQQQQQQAAAREPNTSAAVKAPHSSCNISTGVNTANRRVFKDE